MELVQQKSHHKHHHHHHKYPNVVFVRVAVPALVQTAQVRPKDSADGKTKSTIKFTIVAKELTYKVEKTLQRNTYAKVKLITTKFKNAKLKLAAKIVHRNAPELAGYISKILPREVAIMQLVSDHPNIVKFFDLIQAPNHIIMTMEYVGNVTLKKFIISQSTLDETMARRLLKKLMNGVSFCHSLGIAIRGLKSDNIYLNDNLVPKISNFEHAIAQGCTEDLFNGSSYSAPEVSKPEEHDYKTTDIWSLGVILYTMLTGIFPDDAVSQQKLKHLFLISQLQDTDGRRSSGFKWWAPKGKRRANSISPECDTMSQKQKAADNSKGSASQNQTVRNEEKREVPPVRHVDHSLPSQSVVGENSPEQEEERSHIPQGTQVHSKTDAEEVGRASILSHGAQLMMGIAIPNELHPQAAEFLDNFTSQVETKLRDASYYQPKGKKKVTPLAIQQQSVDNVHDLLAQVKHMEETQDHQQQQIHVNGNNLRPQVDGADLAHHQSRQSFPQKLDQSQVNDINHSSQDHQSKDTHKNHKPQVNSRSPQVNNNSQRTPPNHGGQSHHNLDQSQVRNNNSQRRSSNSAPLQSQDNTRDLPTKVNSSSQRLPCSHHPNPGWHSARCRSQGDRERFCQMLFSADTGELFIPVAISPDCRHLLQNMLCLTSKERPTIFEAMRERWIRLQ